MGQKTYIQMSDFGFFFSFGAISFFQQAHLPACPSVFLIKFFLKNPEINKSINGYFITKL
jgi:hypothetical protein